MRLDRPFDCLGNDAAAGRAAERGVFCCFGHFFFFVLRPCMQPVVCCGLLYILPGEVICRLQHGNINSEHTESVCIPFVSCLRTFQCLLVLYIWIYQLEVYIKLLFTSSVNSYISVLNFIPLFLKLYKPCLLEYSQRQALGCL